MANVTVTSSSNNRLYRGRSTNASNTNEKTQTKSIKILLRPGKYILKRAIDVRAETGVVVSIETIQMPNNLYYSAHRSSSYTGNTTTATSSVGQPSANTDSQLPTNSNNGSRISAKQKIKRLRNLFSCQRDENIEETEIEDYSDEWLDDELQFTTDPLSNGSLLDAQNSTSSSPTATPSFYQNTLLKQQQQPPRRTTACLTLRSWKHNEPAFRVLQGVLQLSNVEIQHSSLGLNIWNGNAAVQIQPPLDADEQPISVEPRPTAILDRVQITSNSGRGIVNVDGGKVVIRQCVVRDCAATGLYVGGPGSTTYVDRTDVIRNGIGNSLRFGGISRGHSGVYLEQGVVKIINSNISYNTLTGISVVSPENALLRLECSSLVSNGTTGQLEQPSHGTASRQRSTVTKDNVISDEGTAPFRSGLTVVNEGPCTTAHRNDDAAANIVRRLRADDPLIMNPNNNH